MEAVKVMTKVAIISFSIIAAGTIIVAVVITTIIIVVNEENFPRIDTNQIHYGVPSAITSVCNPFDCSKGSYHSCCSKGCAVSRRS
jgi:hypothetical protein